MDDQYHNVFESELLSQKATINQDGIEQLKTALYNVLATK